MNILALEFKCDRQLGNEAIRKFSQNIDVMDDSVCTKEPFGCRSCEVRLTSNDCKQLGLASDCDGNRKFKRFSALVMDGKVIGALRDYPVSSSNVQELVGTKRLTSKLLSNRPTRAALKYFTKSVHRLVRSVQYGRGTDVKDMLTRKGGYVHLSLGSLLDVNGVTKSNFHQVANTVRWFCDTNSCLCKASQWTDKMMQDRCVKHRGDLWKKVGPCWHAKLYVSCSTLQEIK